MMRFDRENIIKALDCCSKTNCKECPYTPNEKVDIFDITCSINMANDTLALIKELTEEIKDLEADYDRVYEQAEADIRGNIADGGTSCHWCIAGHRADAVKEMLDRAIDKAVLKAYDDDTERLSISTWELREIAKEMLEENK